mgnify:CR=1 FL=1
MVLDFCLAEFVHHLFGGRHDFFFQLLEGNVGDIEPPQINRLIDYMDDNKPGTELLGKRKGIVKGILRVLGKIGRKYISAARFISSSLEVDRLMTAVLKDLVQERLELQGT